MLSLWIVCIQLVSLIILCKHSILVASKSGFLKFFMEKASFWKNIYQHKKNLISAEAAQALRYFANSHFSTLSQHDWKVYKIRIQKVKRTWPIQAPTWMWSKITDVYHQWGGLLHLQKNSASSPFVFEARFWNLSLALPIGKKFGHKILGLNSTQCVSHIWNAIMDGHISQHLGEKFI
jgi:hypothetical protein